MGIRERYGARRPAARLETPRPGWHDEWPPGLAREDETSRHAARITTIGLLTVALAPSAANPPRPDGPVIPIGASISSRPGVAMDGSGRSFFTWTERNGPGAWDVIAESYGKDGTSRFPPFVVATDAGEPIIWGFSDVEAWPDGRFVVAWNGNHTSTASAQRFDADGFTVGLRADVPTGYWYAYQPRVGTADDGRFVVAWTDAYFLDYPGQMRAQRFDAAGAPSGPTQMLGDSGYYYGYGEVGVSPAGGYSVVWRRPDYSGAGSRIRAFDGTGSPLGQSDEPVSARGFAVSAAPGGGFVTSWTTATSAEARRHDASGQPIGDVIAVGDVVDTGCCSWHLRSSSVDHDAEGGFVIAWSNEDPLDPGVFARRFDASGVPVGGAVRVNAAGTRGSDVDVAVDPDGNFVTAWGEQGGLRARWFCGELAVADPVAASACEGASASFSAPARGRDPFAFQWRAGGADLADGGAISGAATVTLTIDPVSAGDAGLYDALVTDGCATPASVTTSAARLTVDPAVTEEVPGLLVARLGAELRFSWTDVPVADEYVVRQDAGPDGPFATVTGTSPDGTTGLAIPIPPGNVFYLVAGSDAACGEGPL